MHMIELGYKGIGGVDETEIFNFSDLNEVRRHIVDLEERGAQFVTILDTDYPHYSIEVLEAQIL